MLSNTSQTTIRANFLFNSQQEIDDYTEYSEQCRCIAYIDIQRPDQIFSNSSYIIRITVSIEHEKLFLFEQVILAQEELKVDVQMDGKIYEIDLTSNRCCDQLELIFQDFIHQCNNQCCEIQVIVQEV